MLLTGVFERTIDDKGRIQIPSQIRSIVEAANWGRVFYLVRSTRRTVLSLYPEAEFERTAPDPGDILDQTEELETYYKLYYANAWRVEMDGQNRILLPEDPLRQAGLGRELILAGVRNYLDVWNKSEYQALNAKSADNWDQWVASAREASRRRKQSGATRE